MPLIPDIGPSELDSAVYTDPARFEQERRKVLNRSWQIICRSDEITAPGDHVVWEGHGETIVVSRRRDGGVSGFHNVCQHRGARIVPESGKGARRFTCRWHSWSYDLEGTVVGVPDREDFAESQLTDLCSPPVECAEWGGWVWGVLAGPGVAPPLTQWIGDDIVADLGVYRMEDMELHDKLTFELDANWKVVVDGFNENYHAAHLHTISPQDVKDGRHSTYFVSGRNGMMVIPYKGVLPSSPRPATTRAWRSATTRSSRRRSSTTIRTTSSCSVRSRSRSTGPASRSGSSGTRTATPSTSTRSARTGNG